MFKNTFTRHLTIFTLLISVFGSCALAQENQAKIALTSIKKFHQYANHLKKVPEKKRQSDKFKEMVGEKIAETFAEAYNNTLSFASYEIEHANDQIAAGIKPYNISVSADFYHTFLNNTSLDNNDLLFLLSVFNTVLVHIEETKENIAIADVLLEIVPDPSTLSDSLQQMYNETTTMLEEVKNNQLQLNTDKIIVIKMLSELESKIQQWNISDEEVFSYVLFFGLINEIVRL
ncbi:MAG: hypothetical protein KDK51_03190 [Deltaproteobacteria bacterium]|nr:hypothetical protein [Deltaproteobacteria bacterium]